ncbi:MAG: hypothetical protein ACREMU_12050, partial [Gemmatimonadaceae bacterium]
TVTAGRPIAGDTVQSGAGRGSTRIVPATGDLSESQLPTGPQAPPPRSHRRLLLTGVVAVVAIGAALLARGLAHGRAARRSTARPDSVAVAPTTPAATNPTTTPALPPSPEKGSQAHVAENNPAPPRTPGPAADSAGTSVNRSGTGRRARALPLLQAQPRNAGPASTTSAAVNTAPPAATPPSPAPTAALTVGGNPPAGATLVVRDPDGQGRVLTGRFINLPPGDYSLEFSAPGYEVDRQRVHLSAGDSHTWTPVVTEVLKPRPAPSTPPSAQQPPAHDRAADQSSIAGAVRDFAAAFNRRDAHTVVPLLPASTRQNWQDLFDSRAVQNFHAVLEKIAPATIEGDTAKVEFTLHVGFRNANQTLEPVLLFSGTAVRDGRGWRLSSLRSSN